MSVINGDGTTSLVNALIASDPKGYSALMALQRKMTADAAKAAADPKLSKDAAWAAVEQGRK